MTGPRVITLTPRQREVLGQLTHDGADDATIAARLGVTDQTIKSHIKNILRAFGVPNRTAVVVDCLRGRVRVKVQNNSGAHFRKHAA